jgi:hypothetical protein
LADASRGKETLAAAIQASSVYWRKSALLWRFELVRIVEGVKVGFQTKGPLNESPSKRSSERQSHGPEKLGSKIRTNNLEALIWFDQGRTRTYGCNHDKAARRFEQTILHHEDHTSESALPTAFDWMEQRQSFKQYHSQRTRPLYGEK